MRFAVLAVLSAILLSAGPVHANKKDIKGIKKTTQSVIKRIRRQTSAYYHENREILLDRGNIESIGQELFLIARDAKTAHDLNRKNLAEALSNQFAVETTQIVIPAMVDYNKKLLDLVPNYLDQAVYRGSRNFIGGRFIERRRTIGAIIRSQMAALDDIRGAIQESDRFISTVSRELLLFQRESNQPIFEFGRDHYFNALLSRFAAQQQMLESVLIHYLGENLSGRSERPLLCSVEGSVHPVSYFLEEVEWIETLASFYDLGSTLEYTDYREWVQGPITSWQQDYDGFEDIPGRISGFSYCSTVKLNIARERQQRVAVELELGNRELAEKLDILRQESQNEADLLAFQLANAVRANRGQLGLIPSTAAILSADDDPDAWHRAVQAHIKNLKQFSAMMPDLIVAASRLLRRAEVQIEELAAFKDADEQRAAAGNTIEKLDTIRSVGYKRLLDEIKLANGSLDTMSRNGSGGEPGLEDAIRSYQRSMELTFDSREIEELLLPQKLAEARDEVEEQQKRFDNSRVFLNNADLALKQFQSSRELLYAGIQKVNAVLGQLRFNPLFLEVKNMLLEPFLGDPRFRRIQVKLENRLEKMLEKFNGLNNADSLSAQSECAVRFGERPRKAKRKRWVKRCIRKEKRILGGKSGLAREVQQYGEVLAGDTQLTLAKVSEPLFGGENVDELMSAIRSHYRRILELDQ